MLLLSIDPAHPNLVYSGFGIALCAILLYLRNKNKQS